MKVEIPATSFFIFSCFVFRIYLDLTYINLISPLFAYAGLTYDPNMLKLVESYVLMTAIGVIVPAHINKPSDLLIAFLFVWVIIPLFTVYAWQGESRTALYLVLTSFIITSFFRKGKRFKLPMVRSGFTIGMAIVVTCAAVVSIWFVASGGIRYFNLSLLQVYEFRELASEAIGGGPMDYLNKWTTAVFGPALLSYGLLRKSRLITTLGALLHVYWFGVSAHKSVLFSPILVFGIWFWYTRYKTMAFLPIGLTVLGLTTIVMMMVTGSILLPSLFARRIFFVTANNLYDYFEYFSTHPRVYWANSSVGFGIAERVYDQSIARVIAEWRGFGNWVNNSYLATGYMHAGAIGVIVYAFIVGLLFRFMDSLTSPKLPGWMVISVTIIPLQSLFASSDLFAALLTHGIGVGIAILVLLRNSPGRSRSAIEENRATQVPA